MTPAHQAVQGWNVPRLMEWAGRIGPHAKAVIEHVLHQRRHPQQGYRSCLGILRLSKTYSEDRLEAAFERAIDINALSYGQPEIHLEAWLDTAPDGAGSDLPPPGTRQRAWSALLPLVSNKEHVCQARRSRSKGQ
ncbi:MAG: transposase [Betaproteobacteria bacterium]|nr:transposase [Betaproteobacteria bacterium]